MVLKLDFSENTNFVFLFIKENKHKQPNIIMNLTILSY